MAQGNLIERIPGLLRCVGHSGRHGRVWRRAARNGFRAVVLKYHRVRSARDPGSDSMVGGQLSLPAATFERQLRFMLTYFAPVSVSSLLDPNEPKPPLCFAVTFDDGYRDNLTVAAPMLDRLGVPATFFVVGSHVGAERQFWREQLDGILRQADRPCLRRQAIEGWPDACRLPAVLTLRGRRRRERAYTALSSLLIRTRKEAVPACLRSLADALGTQVPHGRREVPMMTWEDIRRLQEQGHEVGAHTMNHVSLGCVDRDQARSEIEQSVEVIRRELGTPPVSFAYPYGTSSSFDDGVIDLLKGSGCRGAFTVLPGIVGPSSSPWTLPRVSLSRPLRFVWACQICEAFRAGASCPGVPH